MKTGGIMKELREILSSYRGKRGELVPILQEVQAEFGYLPEKAMLEIAAFTGIPESEVFAVATFYAQFRLMPLGRNRIMICRGTACHVRGTPRILEEMERLLGVKEGETTPDLEYTLESVACIGCCGLAPCMMINADIYGQLTPQKIRDIFAVKGGQDAG